MTNQITYADAGVNIELGDDASKVLYNAAKQTWENRKGKLGELIVPFDDFSGVRAIDVSGLPEGTLMNIGFDGVGTKMELAERINNHRTIAHDLFAMVCDDAVVRGAEPVLIGSILDVNSLGKGNETHIEKVKQLAQGYIEAAKAANVAIVNGEVAELGSRVGGYGEFNYNWGAAVVWFAKKDRMFTGKEIQPGDYIIGLAEEGFRSNGLSLVRKIMKDAHGENWHEKEHNGKNLAELALIPSKIYCAAVVDMFGGFEGTPKAEVHGVAHITGGGIPGKLGRVLKPSGLDANIYNPFEPSEFLRYVQELGNVPDREAYKTWNMGQGMLIITPDHLNVMKVAFSHGITAKEIGRVEKTKESRITIKNNGFYRSQEPELLFTENFN
ncbi:MAG: AIR synthase-related protein [Nanoarchaeota archaeon]|nr:AIR synthase-related protein [Nanoarchaeota archaeon]